MVNCSHINELDVRILNFLIQTSVTQVMALFPWIVQLGQYSSTSAPRQVTSLVSAPQPVHLGQDRSARPV